MYGSLLPDLNKIEQDIDLGPLIKRTGGVALVGAMLHAERQKYEEERRRLYQELDKKAAETRRQSECVEKVKMDVLKLVELTRQHYEVLEQRLNLIIMRFNDSATTITLPEARKIVKELAEVNDRKAPEIKENNRKIESLIKEITSWKPLSSEMKREKRGDPPTNGRRPSTEMPRDGDDVIGLDSDVKISSNDKVTLEEVFRVDHHDLSEVKSESSCPLQPSQGFEATGRDKNKKTTSDKEEDEKPQKEATSDKEENETLQEEAASDEKKDEEPQEDMDDLRDASFPNENHQRQPCEEVVRIGIAHQEHVHSRHAFCAHRSTVQRTKSYLGTIDTCAVCGPAIRPSVFRNKSDRRRQQKLVIPLNGPHRPNFEH